MHHNSITIALTDEKKKPYREYGFKKLSDKCKTSEVALPFESHYQILAKNDNAERIKLDIDIDGTIVTGSGLIIAGNSQAYIERFVDTAKKLFFTKKTDERVADPTNAENGFLTIKVVKEKFPVFSILNTMWPWPRHPDLPGYDYYSNQYDYDYTRRYLYNPHPHQPSSWGSASGNTLRFSGIGDVTGSTAQSGGITSKSVPASYTCNLNASASASTGSVNCMNASLETGATVEGDASKQTFSTTNWNGEQEDSEYIFRFKMLGKDNKLSAQEEKDLMEYKRLKAKFEGI